MYRDNRNRQLRTIASKINNIAVVRITIVFFDRLSLKETAQSLLIVFVSVHLALLSDLRSFLRNFPSLQFRKSESDRFRSSSQTVGRSNRPQSGRTFRIRVPWLVVHFAGQKEGGQLREHWGDRMRRSRSIISFFLNNVQRFSFRKELDRVFLFRCTSAV